MYGTRGLAQPLDRADGLGELHQRSVPSCMRAPPDADTTMSGIALRKCRTRRPA